MATIPSLVLAGVLAAGGGGPSPRGLHALAFVNDPLSHGTLGDGLLSLDEAIRLHNGTLLYAQLSPAEQAQLSLIPGTGTNLNVAWIDIDGTNTPVITIQQDLTPIVDTPWGLLIKGFGDRPVLDFSGPGITHGLRSTSNSLTLQDLVLSGGPYGAEILQTDASGQVGFVASNVRFEGYGGTGLRVVGQTVGGVGRVILERCEFHGGLDAIWNDEQVANRITIFEAHDLDIRATGSGIHAVIGAAGSTRYTFDRVNIEAQQGIRLARAPGGDRQAYLEGAYVRVRAPQCVLISCHPTGLTWAQLNLWDLRVPGAGTALSITGGGVFGDLTECTLGGSVLLLSTGAPMPLAIHNARIRNSQVVLSVPTTQPLLVTESRFDGGSLTSTGLGSIAATDCCFVGTTVSASSTAPLQLTRCYAAISGGAVVSNLPRLAESLGSMSIVPEEPTLGGAVQFAADLPPGLFGVFALGFTDPTPLLLAPPYRIYCELSAYALAPGVYSGQQSFSWTAPTSIAYLGTDLMAQILVIPAAGVDAPWLQMPPGRRFVLR
jgi:hypothetical protein